MVDGLGLGDVYNATVERIKENGGDKSTSGLRILMSPIVMDTIRMEHIMGGILDHNLIEGTLIAIDHGHCLSIVKHSRLSSTIPE